MDNKLRSYDEFLVPDYDPTEYKSLWEHYQDFIEAFNPYKNTVMQQHRKVYHVQSEMLKCGFSDFEIAVAADEARKYWNLDPIERDYNNLRKKRGSK